MSSKGYEQDNRNSSGRSGQQEADAPELTALLIHPSVNLLNLSPESRTRLGYQLETGDSPFLQDYDLARTTYLSAAGDGNPIAMNNLGWLYVNGYGVEKDLQKAEEYFRESADFGCTIAMINLGNLAEDREDYAQAYDWYRRAYMLGDPVGQYNYANMYHWGWYVEQNYDYACRNFRDLAERKFVDAYFYVGYYLQNGLGTEKDEEQALHWFERGEQAGDAVCTTELGRCLSLGLGTAKDEAKGFQYYLEAAERGDLLAYANVGACYENGQGTKKNLDLARKYYSEGARKGEEHCKEALQDLDRTYPEGQVSHGSADDHDASFLAHVQEIAGTQGEKLVRFLMQAVRAMGIKTGYSNGTVFTSPVLNIAPRTRPAGEYIRLEQRISKLVVENRLSEKKVSGLFRNFGDRHDLWKDKRLKIQSGCYYLELTALFDEEVLRDFLQLLRELAVKHLPQRAKVLSGEQLWELYREGMKADDAGGSGTAERSGNPPAGEQEAQGTAKESDDQTGSSGSEELHNEIIERALDRFRENPTSVTYTGILLALHQRLLEGGSVMIPLVFPSDPDGEGGSSAPGPVALKNGKGELFLPVLTSEGMKDAHPGWSIFATMTLKNALLLTRSGEEEQVGIVLNPYSEGAAEVDWEMVKALLDSLEG